MWTICWNERGKNRWEQRPDAVRAAELLCRLKERRIINQTDANVHVFGPDTESNLKSLWREICMGNIKIPKKPVLYVDCSILAYWPDRKPEMRPHLKEFILFCEEHFDLYLLGNVTEEMFHNSILAWQMDRELEQLILDAKYLDWTRFKSPANLLTLHKEPIPMGLERLDEVAMADIILEKPHFYWVGIELSYQERLVLDKVKAKYSYVEFERWREENALPVVQSKLEALLKDANK